MEAFERHFVMHHMHLQRIRRDFLVLFWTVFSVGLAAGVGCLFADGQAQSLALFIASLCLILIVWTFVVGAYEDYTESPDTYVRLSNTTLSQFNRAFSPSGTRIITLD